MARNYRPQEMQRKAKAKRDLALIRNEFRYPSVPRVSAAGATSAPLKARDPADALLIEAYLRQIGDKR